MLYLCLISSFAAPDNASRSTEMVGIKGNESCLARLSMVNYTGAIILDAFVRQRLRVVDYCTQWSGVHRTDMVDHSQVSRVSPNQGPSTRWPCDFQ